MRKVTIALIILNYLYQCKKNSCINKKCKGLFHYLDSQKKLWDTLSGLFPDHTHFIWFRKNQKREYDIMHFHIINEWR